ncbi:hypothetical protein TNCT_159971 [Trichonephila clavata]|uniref:Uncharacterized protein n=1 Tax=Trichonephila clavata TaxID=2740835 RepID=A0A8X6H8I0_TRICU|nr:hypothetical protein TNCT_159971 [Trichonephila clavata]
MQLPIISLSLRQMCFCKIALQVFNDPDVRLFTSTHDIHSCIWSSGEIEAFLGKEPTTLLNYVRVYDIISKEKIPTLRKYKYSYSDDGKDHSLPYKQWEFLIGQKISALQLQNILKKEAAALVRLVFVESDKWLHDHARIMDTIMDTKNLQNNFYWTQHNKIDRQKTAKAIIANNYIDTRGRFIVACHYCFQEDVFSLWGILDDAQQNLLLLSSYDIERMWVNWARNRVELHWEEIVRISEGLQTYLPKLEQKKKDSSI